MTRRLLTPTEAHDLYRIAIRVSSGTAGRYTTDDLAQLAADAARLAVVWRDTGNACVCCPRRHPAHTCGCPHAQARKRLRAFGVWPEETPCQ